MDPCLFSKRSKLGIYFIVLYVDDNLIIGHPEAVDDTIDQLRKNNLMLKVENNLHDYISCEIVLSDDRTKEWLGQPHLISNLEKKYGEEVQKLYNYLIPGTPGLHQVREKRHVAHSIKRKAGAIPFRNWYVALFSKAFTTRYR